jgi:hypothetical protein
MNASLMGATSESFRAGSHPMIIGVRDTSCISNLLRVESRRAIGRG